MGRPPVRTGAPRLRTAGVLIAPGVTGATTEGHAEEGREDGRETLEAHAGKLHRRAHGANVIAIARDRVISSLSPSPDQRGGGVGPTAGAGVDVGAGAGVGAGSLRVVAGSMHLPASQIRSPLHCVSYWQPAPATDVSAAGDSGVAVAGPPASSLHDVGSPNVQKYAVPRHCAFQTRLNAPSRFSEIVISSGGQPTWPALSSAKICVVTHAGTNAKRAATRMPRCMGAHGTTRAAGAG